MSYGSVDPSRIASHVLSFGSWGAWRLSHWRGASANDGRNAASLLAPRADRRVHSSCIRALKLATSPGAGTWPWHREDSARTAAPRGRDVYLHLTALFGIGSWGARRGAGGGAACAFSTTTLGLSLKIDYGMFVNFLSDLGPRTDARRAVHRRETMSRERSLSFSLAIYVI
eukprot:scaffold29629_cov59-Phaeocystis_antarctica.AAC.5